MRRFSVLLSLTGAVLVGTLAVQLSPGAIAQEATPAAQAGVTFEAVAFASSIPLPATGDVSVARISFAPGTGFPMAAIDPVHGLAVIGFTTSLFIAGLAFGEGALLDQAKVGILVAAIIAGVGGWGVLSHAATEDRRSAAR